MRTLTYLISPEDSGLRAEQFLLRHGFSRPLLLRMKHTEGSLLRSGSPCRLIDHLMPGDILSASIPEDTPSETVIPSPLPLDIRYEDEDILIINKPAGMPIHPSKANPDNSLANALAWYYQERHIPFVFRCTNRLDRDTSGLTVIARNALSSAILSDMAVRHAIRREYLAIVRGTVVPPEGTIDAPLGRRPGVVIERMVDYEQGESAITHYHTLTFKNGYSLLSVILETGRTHQIRIHMKSIGFPLIGDYLYNPGDRSAISRQALHAWKLAFPHPVTGKPLIFTAPLPDDMRQVLE